MRARKGKAGSQPGESSSSSLYDKKNSNSNCTSQMNGELGMWNEFPLELWYVVFEFLNKQELRKAGMVCSLFNTLTNQPSIYNKAPWPLLDYDNVLHDNNAIYNYERKVERSNHDETPKRFLMQNGDLLYGLPDGSLIYLAFRSKVFVTLGKHRYQENGQFLNAKVADVILLADGRLASCAKGGIQIWGKKNKKRLQFLKADSFDSQPEKLIQMRNGDLLAGCITDIRLYAQRESSQSSHFFLKSVLSIGKKADSSLVLHDINLGLMGAEQLVVAEYYQKAIICWQTSITEPIKIWQADDLQNFFINAINDQALKENEEKLSEEKYLYIEYDWSLLKTSSFAIAKAGERIFLFDVLAKAPPLFLGMASGIEIKITNDNALFVVKRDGLHFQLFYEINYDCLVFNKSLSIDLKVDKVKTDILNESYILFRFKGNNVVLWDFEENSCDELLLQIPDVPSSEYDNYLYYHSSWHFKLLDDLHLLAYDAELGTTVIWNVSTGGIIHHFQVNESGNNQLEFTIEMLANGDIAGFWYDRDARRSPRNQAYIRGSDHVKRWSFGLFSQPVTPLEQHCGSNQYRQGKI